MLGDHSDALVTVFSAVEGRRAASRSREPQPGLADVSSRPWTWTAVCCVCSGADITQDLTTLRPKRDGETATVLLFAIPGALRNTILRLEILS